MNASPVAVGLVSAGLLLAASPASAEILKLDCSVSVDTYNVSEGRDGRDSGSSRGVWKVRAMIFPEASDVTIEQSTPFGVPYTRAGLDTDYLEGWDDEPTVSEDRIEWCPDRRGCGVQIPFLSGNGWYSVSRAVIDRRRGTLSVRVEYYSRLAGVQMDNTYYGTCAPEPERQF